MGKLKLSYDSQEEIPEGLSDYYKEDDGKFRVQVEGMKTQKDVEKVKNALDNERQQRIEAEKKLSSIPDDFDVDRWENVKHLDPDSIPDADKINERLQEVESKWKKKVSDVESTKEEIQTKFQKTIVESQLKDYLLENGVTNPLHLEDALNRIQRKHGTELVEEDDKFKVVAGSLKEPLEEFVKEWASSEEGKNYVRAKDNNGGGADNHNGGGNGVDDAGIVDKDGNVNYTELGKLKNTNPVKYKQICEKHEINTM